MLPKPELCRGCAGYSWDDATGFTLNEGNGNSGLLAVAEAPGYNEAEESRPLSPNGASGKVFRRALRELGIPARELTISNVLRCRPPGNELLNMPYEREAIEHCQRTHFAVTMREAQPRVLLALGDIPLRTLRGPDMLYAGSNTVVRGFLLQSKYEGVPLVATYHPSYIARGAWQLFGALKNDIAYAYRLATQGVPQPLETQYELNPSVDRVRSYCRYLVDNPLLPIAYDVETAHILGEPEPNEWRAKRIVQIQFSHRPGFAIVLPYSGEYRTLAHAILALPNPKYGWNSRLSDDLALRADGVLLGGELHDLMNAWGHLQPSYWGKDKSDTDSDKGVPSRLMGLQSCTSFYAPEIGPWKHLGTPEHIKADPTVLPYYGAIDADATQRCGVGIFRELETLGLMDGYRSHKLALRPVLDYLGEIGLPVDRDRQAALREYVTGELQRIQTDIQRQVPAEVLSIHPKAGYKSLAGKMAYAANPDEKIALKSILASYDPSEPPLVIAAGYIGYLVQRVFHTETTVDADEKSATANYTSRWCVERLYNPHGSSPNTKAYIRAMGYRMPKKIGTEEDTTGKNELKKLADETGDPVLKLTGEWRELAKTGNDYTTGLWVPGPDGRVHATFKFGTASGQLVAVTPAVMTYPEHSGIAKKAKEAIRAQPGHKLVKIDMRGFHSRMIGWLANDAAYYKLADFDVHSFITAHFLHLPDAPYLLDMDDDELRGALHAIKEAEEYTRNYKVKRTVHGRQFNMGVNKLYDMHSQNFDPKPDQMIELAGEARWHDWDLKRRADETARVGRREARALFDLFDQLFPGVFVVYPEIVSRQIHEVTPWRLVTPFGHHRFFYDYDLEQATAFGPSNCAHCHIQAALVRLWDGGAIQKYEMVNITHDAGWFHPLEELVSECIEVVQFEFERPSHILEDSPLGPFQCNSDAEVGDDLAHMTAWEG